MTPTAICYFVSAPKRSIGNDKLPVESISRHSIFFVDTIFFYPYFSYNKTRWIGEFSFTNEAKSMLWVSGSINYKTKVSSKMGSTEQGTFLLVNLC